MPDVNSTTAEKYRDGEAGNGEQMQRPELYVEPSLQNYGTSDGTGCREVQSSGELCVTSRRRRKQREDGAAESCEALGATGTDGDGATYVGLHDHTRISVAPEEELPKHIQNEVSTSAGRDRASREYGEPDDIRLGAKHEGYGGGGATQTMRGRGPTPAIPPIQYLLQTAARESVSERGRRRVRNRANHYEP
ncbi:hypothetical protein GN958_ATG12336 [Phytophthora infestans]|uniref:Uncharacterized protein n=2 Tax=Phytophthora infestans TaxID=4787 RepID=A0A8S9UD19_PHYIN|nr:hypothetical protein GN958_ATG12336 [Phytophthora infestans]